MNIPLFLAGVILILIVLGDAFETMVLPRRVTRRVRLARLFFRYAWKIWLTIARLITSRRGMETFLGFFGPLSVLILIILWATGLVFGFAFMLFASGSTLAMPEGSVSFGTYLYLSGTSLFTLGLGDVTPTTPLGRGIIAAEAGLGLGFLALVISYLPLLNQSFARREVTIALLDAHAGSPPTAMEMLHRHIHHNEVDELRQHLYEWERWSAELLESHLSYPVLARFRSHHENQSWLGSLTAILDTCAFALAAWKVSVRIRRNSRLPWRDMQLSTSHRSSTVLLSIRNITDFLKPTLNIYAPHCREQVSSSKRQMSLKRSFLSCARCMNHMSTLFPNTCILVFRPGFRDPSVQTIGRRVVGILALVWRERNCWRRYGMIIFDGKEGNRSGNRLKK